MLGQTARQSDLLIATVRPAAKVGTNCGVTWILSIARRYRCHVSSLSDVLRKYAEQLGKHTGQSKWYEISRVVEKVMFDNMQKEGKKIGVRPGEAKA